MADWPADGTTNWNVTMKANIDVGHDSDGTHKKSQMLTDMGWSPTSYAGGETATFPNGLIMKMGVKSLNNNGNTTVTFGTAFPNAIVSVTLTMRSVVHAAFGLRLNSAPTVNNFVVDNANTVGTYVAEWIAIGY